MADVLMAYSLGSCSSKVEKYPFRRNITQPS